jgi:phage repressor protein C with HTH and peptisase S24 domain
MLAVEKELILEQLRLRNRCCIRVGGFCMSPEIRNGAEVVIERSIPEQLTIGDVVAYFIGSNLFIHRIAEKKSNLLRMRSDNDSVVQHDVSVDEILGRVKIIRNPHIVQRVIVRVQSLFNRISRSW